MNHVIKTLWPHIGKVVFKQAVDQAGPILDDICKKVLMQHWCCQSICAVAVCTPNLGS